MGLHKNSPLLTLYFDSACCLEKDAGFAENRQLTKNLLCCSKLPSALAGESQGPVIFFLDLLRWRWETHGREGTHVERRPQCGSSTEDFDPGLNIWPEYTMEQSMGAWMVQRAAAVLVR